MIQRLSHTTLMVEDLFKRPHAALFHGTGQPISLRLNHPDHGQACDGELCGVQPELFVVVRPQYRRDWAVSNAESWPQAGGGGSRTVWCRLPGGRDLGLGAAFRG